MWHVAGELGLALRRLLRDPGFFVPAVLTIALGLGIAASVFALVEGILIRPLDHPDADRLVSIRHVARTGLAADGTSAGIFLHYRDGSRAFEAIAAYSERSFTFTDGTVTERVRTAFVTPELFTVLRVVPRLGRLPNAADYRLGNDLTGTTGALMSHALWVRRYGADPDIVGRRIEIERDLFVEVMGIAREGFTFPDPGTEAWLVTPQEAVPWRDEAQVPIGMYMSAIGRLRPGVGLTEAQADLDRLVQTLPEKFGDITADQLAELGLRTALRPYRDEVVGDVRTALLLVLASGGFLLLVTWANVANLLLLRTDRRRHEIGILRAIGAGDGHVVGRLLAECLVLTFTGGVIALGITETVVGARFGFAPHQLPRLDEVGVNAIVVGVIAALSVVSGLLMAGLCFASTRNRAAGPALSALRSRSATQGREGQTGRRVLVAAQLAFALTLLVGSGLMARTFWQLRQVDPGVRTEMRLSVHLPATLTGLAGSYHELSQLHGRVAARLRQVPGVDAVEIASPSVFPLTLPDGAFHDMAIARRDQVARADVPIATYGFASPDYFDLMGIPLVAGRTFDVQDASEAAPGVILSEILARELFPDVDPIGRAVQFDDLTGFGWPDLYVVGVVGDVRGRTMREGRSRAVYLPLLQSPAAAARGDRPFMFVPRAETYVLATNRDAAALVPELRRALDAVDARIPMLDVRTLDEIVAAATAQERIIMRLLLLSAAGALLLGVVGIFSVVAYSVGRRTAEIGIRMALGASPARVTRLVVLQGAVLSGAGIIAGLATAVLLSRFIAALLYETNPTDPATYAVTTLLLFGVALAASYIPARRASRVEPANALRAE